MAYFYAVVSLLLLYPLYKLYKSFSMPSSLAHLPTVPPYEFILSLLKQESNGDRINRLFPPDIGKDGLCMMWFAGKMQLIVSSSKLTAEIFSDATNFHKGVPGEMNLNKLMAEFFGDSNIVQSDGEVWKTHRKTINPAFKKSWDTRLFGLPALDLISILESHKDKPIVVNELMQKLTLDVLGKGLLSIDFEALTNSQENKVISLYNRSMKGLFNPLYMALPFLENIVPSRKQTIETCKELRQHFKDIIKQRYQEIERGEHKDDILSLTIRASLDGESMSDSDIVNNLATFFLAGHDTTAHTLTSNLYFLARYPEVQTKVRDEIIQVMGNVKDTIPTIEQQKAFVYMNQFIKESMRLFSSVAITPRLCVKDVKLSNEVIVPKGVRVLLMPWSAHHDPKVFSNPKEFNPDRFKDPYGEQSQKWIPFGVGSRMCIGSNFSLIEQRVVMAMLLQKFTIVLGPKASKLEKPKMNTFGISHPVNLDLIFKLR